MNAELIAVGTELLLGNTVNTDARDLSEGLSALGINVFWHTVVGDNPERLAACVEIARSRADLIITTGGLGPTCDDLTKQVLAKAFGLELYYDEEEAQSIRDWFEKMRRIPMTENNLQQAWLPVGCTIFHNEWGTAPGCAFEKDGVRVIMLPGPPSECNAMFEACAVPYLRALSDTYILSHSLRIFGMGESSVEAKLRDLMNELTNPTLAPYAKTGEVMLRVTAKAKSEAEAEEMMRPVMMQVYETLGDMIYGVDVDSLEALVNQYLEYYGTTLAVAESCTGGLLAKRLTDIPGASARFLGGVTVYTNEAKMALLGIPGELIEEHGAVSSEVASELALAVRDRLGTELGVGITGLAGPDGDGVHKVGLVYVALAAQEEVVVRELNLGGKTTRERIRTLAANHALDMVRRHLAGLQI
jgi:nicotinamide-nucleotide amidase